MTVLIAYVTDCSEVHLEAIEAESELVAVKQFMLSLDEEDGDWRNFIKGFCSVEDAINKCRNYDSILSTLII